MSTDKAPSVTQADRIWPDIGPDPFQMDSRKEGTQERLRKAFCVQQQEVPDQTALVWRVDLMDSDHEAIRLKAQLDLSERRSAELRAEIERLKHDSIVDGKLKCAKCDFVLIKTVLNAADGKAYADSEPDDCPNCKVPMWRITWKNEANEAFKTAESQMNRALQVEAEIERLRAERFEPLGDNHHNAAKCPHCNPEYEAQQAEIARLHELLLNITAAQRVELYRGWNLSALNRAVDEVREHLRLASVLELNLDIAAMVEAAKASAGSMLSAQPAEQTLPSDVVRLVIAARTVAFGDWGGLSEEWEVARKELDDASEAFASRVEWPDTPEDAEQEQKP